MTRSLSIARKSLFVCALAMLLPAAAQALAPPASAPQASAPQAFAPMALNSFSLAPAKIASARVLDRQGQPVGTVQKIETDASGKPRQLDVRLSASGAIVPLDASAVSYDETGNILMTSLEAPKAGKPG